MESPVVILEKTEGVGLITLYIKAPSSLKKGKSENIQSRFQREIYNA